MEEWKEYKLGEIAQIQTGPFGSQLHKSDYVDDGVPCIMPTNIGKNLDVISDGIAHISENDAQRLSRHLVTAGDIIYARRGDIEKCAYIQEQQNGWFCGTGCLRIRINKDADSHFIAYQLSTSEAKSWIVGNAVGTTMLNLNSSILSDLPVLLPSLFTQRHITAILKSLDDKIEVNRRINDNLEQQAQALFKSWFVDFEPFKDQPFVESELGMIPQSLQIKYISDIPHVLETGRRPKGGVGDLAHGIPSVGAEHVKGMGNYDYSKTKYISEEYAATLKTGRVKGYELLIYKDGGKPGYFIPNYSIFGEGYPFEECYLNEHVFRLDFNDRGFNAFCYFYFRTDYVMNYLNAQGGKAAIPGINRQDIENILIYGPDNELVKNFGEYVLPMIKKMLLNCKESRRLAELRDTLLPRLMQGKLNVKEVTF